MKHDERAAYAHVLQLESRGDSRLNAETYHVYNWPSHVNGSQWDRTVVIEEFSDGSCAIYLDAQGLDFKAKLLALREMANL